MKKGIDVSYHQGDIDWASVKASGVLWDDLGAVKDVIGG